MKNSKYFPFERNKYFYGKLLSVDDFDLEQKYMNDKRRLANRFLFGSGIVAGMYVVMVDERSISVETGYALDASGREIVIDAPVMKKLSLIEGFDRCLEGNQTDYVYLCIDYQETETGQVHNIAGNSILARDKEEMTYNKIKETYRLYLTSQEPEGEYLSPAALYEETKTIYFENGIHIRHCMPRYVKAGQKIEFRIEIENTSKQYVAFSYDLLLNSLLYETQSVIKVNFNEMLYEKTGTYTLTYLLDSCDIIDVEGSAVIDSKSVKLFVGKEQKMVEIDGKSTVDIGNQNPKTRLIRDYYKTAMDSVMKSNYQSRIYLARIYLVKAGDNYVIDNIQNVPFHQYVMNQNLGSAIQQIMMKELAAVEQSGDFQGRQENGSSKLRKENESGIQMAQGVCTLLLKGGGQKGERYQSDEITHGLGLGKVVVYVGLETKEKTVTFGSSEIFPDTQPMLELAAKVYEEKGTFVIGGRLLAPTMENGVKIHWTAIKNVEEKVVEMVNRKIFIKPSILELKTRESYYLEAVCENMGDKSIEWKVKDQGGIISHNGMYTAPNTPGVYEVVAQSVAYKEVKASIFVIVREEV